MSDTDIQGTADYVMKKRDSMESGRFVPTEEELKELGFEMTVTDGRTWYLDCKKNRVIEFSEKRESFHIGDNGHWIRCYPKSFEELRLLINMMNP